jgi:hypothetical protein
VALIVFYPAVQAQHLVCLTFKQLKEFSVVVNQNPGDPRLLVRCAAVGQQFVQLR